MGRPPCCDKNGLKKGPWTPEEDQKLIDYIHKHGHGSWRTLPNSAGLARCGKSCRLRWTNYLRPGIKRGRFSFEEEEAIIQLHSILGNKWSAIAARLPGRTDNEIKNYWNTSIRKRLLRMGIDPVTHKPRGFDLLGLTKLLLISSSSYNPAADQSDMPSLVGHQQPFINTTDQLLRMVTNLLSSQSQSSDMICKQKLQQQQYLTPQFQEALQNPGQEIPPSNAKILLDDPPLMQENGGTRLRPADQTDLWRGIASQANLPEDIMSSTTSWLSYESLEPSVPRHIMVSEPSKFDQINNTQNYYCNLTSLVSTPAASPTNLNSSMTSASEDDGDSFLQQLFKFQVPDQLLDLSEYL